MRSYAIALTPSHEDEVGHPLDIVVFVHQNCNETNIQAVGRGAVDGGLSTAVAVARR